MKTISAVVVALFGLLALALPAQAQDTGTVTVIHGVPGLTVDVYVNGELTLEGFEPDTVTDPLELPAGDYEIDIRPAGEPADSDPAISGSATLPAGANASIVAHLDADGNPTLGVFVNDTAATEAGQGRLVVRHTAAAPAVDVLAGGEAVFTDLSNGNEASADLPVGTVSASVAAAGTTDPVIGPADVPVVEGQSTIVYAVGSLEDGNLDVLVQTINVGAVAAAEGAAPGEPAPEVVPAGDSGLAVDDDSLPVAGIALAAIAGVGILFSARALVRSRA